MTDSEDGASPSYQKTASLLHHGCNNQKLRLPKVFVTAELIHLDLSFQVNSGVHQCRGGGLKTDTAAASLLLAG
ncbi:hypothetical protein MLD38_002499 [Melastoma candidum]|uniref:Uncharacterized protein n=1 Tax=Melastoma candidum TaxID=119954 RepID=A0ACB9RZ70_9MYRT|nr:hypothetical protein MLD38_002499 [Melastoma candidum]